MKSVIENFSFSILNKKRTNHVILFKCYDKMVVLFTLSVLMDLTYIEIYIYKITITIIEEEAILHLLLHKPKSPQISFSYLFIQKRKKKLKI